MSFDLFVQVRRGGFDLLGEFENVLFEPFFVGGQVEVFGSELYGLVPLFLELDLELFVSGYCFFNVFGMAFGGRLGLEF